jgi:uncharacterized membrane protein YfcA
VPITPVEVIAAFVAVTVGAVVQGSVGFGAALVAAPVLLLLDRAFLPGPMLLAGILLAVLMSRRDWQSVDRRGVGIALVGRALGLVPAVLLVGALSDAAFSMVCAMIILAAVAVSVAGWHVAPTMRNTFIAGTISGFTGTLASMGGPPMALLYQHEAADKLRGTIALYFVLGGLLSLSALTVTGHFGHHELALAAVLVPGIVLGFLLSRFTAPLLGPRRMRPAVLIVSAATAVLVLLRAVGAAYW